MRTSTLAIVDLELGQPDIIHRPLAAQSAKQRECGAVAPLMPQRDAALAHMLMADPDTRPEAEQAFVSALLLQTPDLASGIAVAKRLNLLFRRKSQESLEAVLADAASTPLAEFAANMRRDLAAVQAAFDLPWTTSPAEGQISRLKMLGKNPNVRRKTASIARRAVHHCWGGRPRGILCQDLVVNIRT